MLKHLEQSNISVDSHSQIQSEDPYSPRDESQLSIQQLEDVQDSLDISASMIQNKLGIHKIGMNQSSPRNASPPTRFMGASQNYIVSSSKKPQDRGSTKKFEKFENHGIVPAIQPMATPSARRRGQEPILSS